MGLAKLLAVVVLGFLPLVDRPRCSKRCRGGGDLGRRLKIREGVQLRLVFHVKTDDAGVRSVTVDSPQSERQRARTDFSVEDGTLQIEMTDLVASFSGKLDAESKTATGTWRQRGGLLPLTLTKVDKPTAAPAIAGKEQIWEGKNGRWPAGLSLRMVFMSANRRMDSSWGRSTVPTKASTASRRRPSASTRRRSTSRSSRSTATTTARSATTSGNDRHLDSGIAKLPLNLKVVEKATEQNRPQTPKAPFPYVRTPGEIRQRPRQDGARGGVDHSRRKRARFRPSSCSPGRAPRTGTRPSWATSPSSSWPTISRGAGMRSSGSTTGASAARPAPSRRRRPTTSRATPSRASPS